jgi:hypothetical protein
LKRRFKARILMLNSFLAIRYAACGHHGRLIPLSNA